ncbi:MAG: autotransporter outer membrane beta-barrel domain-containing protein [Planctomycetaceae bacterium]|nr:autotransporter outer membrane beta-barrel domain-containing protein [Planctomycetaceae bacterium]
MKTNIWGKMLPMLVTSVMCGNALAADTVTVNFTTDKATVNFDNHAIPGLGGVLFDGFAAYGVTGTSNLLISVNPNADTLTFTGGAAGATFSYVNGGNIPGGDATANGSVFAFRGVGNVNGLLNLNIENLTFTGGNRFIDDTHFGAVDTIGGTNTPASKMAFGGGGYINNFGIGQTVTITNSNFYKNQVVADGTGIGGVSGLNAGGGGLNLNNSTVANIGNVKAVLNNVSIKGNKAYANNTGGIGDAYGGGLTLANFASIDIDGKNTAVIGDNTVLANKSGNAVGGGIAIFNQVSGAKSFVTIKNIDIIGNLAKSTDDDPLIFNDVAVGGGLWLEGYGNSTGIEVTLTDVNFIGNKVEGDTNAMGGAIFANDNELTIESVNRDVLFDGNTVKVGAGKAATNSITSWGNVTFDAAAGRKITDNDGIVVGGNVTKKGDGELALLGGFDVDGNFAVDKGTLTINSVKDNLVGGDLTGTGKIAIFGDDELALKVDGTNSFNGNIEVRDSFSVYEKVNNNIEKTGTAASVKIGDGYLALISLHNFNAGYQAVQDHFISGRARLVNPKLKFLGQSECDPCGDYPDGSNSASKNGKTRSVWFNYVGRANQYYSNTLETDWNINSNGVQLGFDLFRTNNNQLGVLGGYEKATADAGQNSVESDDAYVGVYAAHVFSRGADFRGVVNFGWQGYDSNRWTLAGRNPRLASFNGKTIEGNLEFGKRFYRTSNFSFRPAVGVDVYVNNVDATSETGFKAGTHANAVRYNGLSYTQMFLRFGSDFQFERERVKLNGGLFYSYDLNDNTLKASVTGVTKVVDHAAPVTPAEYKSSTVYGSDLGREILTVNISGSFAVTKRSDLFAGFTGNAYIDRDGTPFQSVGYIGGLIRW